MEFLVFVTFCVTIATLIVVASLNSKNKQTDQKVEGLHHAVGALHYKVDALQHRTSEHREADETKVSSTPLAAQMPAPTPAPTQQTHTQAPTQPVTQAQEQSTTPAPAHVTAAHMAAPAPAPAPAQAPEQTSAQASAQTPTQAPAQAPTQVPAQAPEQTSAQDSAQTPTQAPAQTPEQTATPATTPTPQQSMPTQHEQSAQPQHRMPVTTPQPQHQVPVPALHRTPVPAGQNIPTPAPQQRPYPYTQAAPVAKSSANMEKIIGKNILPFLAAGMVFIGLIFLAILVVPTMTAFQRFIGMFALSGAIFAVGFVLARRKKNIFSIALLGTGIGSLFISILMTRIYFNYLSDIPTFALLLVWMIVCMGLVKMFNSLTLSITAHVGMAISIIFAFTQGFDQQRALIVIAYQIVATIVIVGGSLLAYRKTYRFGLLASLGLTIVATIAIRSQDLAEFSTSVIVASYIIQFVTASAVSFFLATSSARLGKDARLAFHYANKTLWIIVAPLTLYPAVFHGLMSALGLDKLPSLTDEQSLLVETIPVLVCIVVFVAHALISALLERTIDMPSDMVHVSVIVTISGAAVMALYQMTTTLHYNGSVPIPFLFVLALIALGIARLLRDRAYMGLATALLAIEAIIAVTSIYLVMTNTPAVLIFIWIVAIMATSVAIWASWQPAEKRRTFVPVLIILNLLFFEITLPQAIATIDNTSLGWAATLVTVLLILTVLRALNIEAALGMTQDHHVVFAINEYVIALVAFITVGMNGESATVAEQVLLWIATALVIVMSFVRIIQSRNVSALHPQPIQYLSAIMLTLATQAPLLGLVRLGEGSPFVSSVVAMFVALVLVGMGFALRLKPVRLYGLGLTIFAVLKLATYDLSNISPVGRVIAFIVGGLIAFGISALYNYADKRLNPSRAGRQDAPTPSPYPAMVQAGVPQGMPQPMTGYPVASHVPTGQMPTGVPVAPNSQVPTGQVPMDAPVPTGQVPVQAQPVTGQPPMTQPMQTQPAPAQPAVGQPAVGQPARTQPVTPQTEEQPQS